MRGRRRVTEQKQGRCPPTSAPRISCWNAPARRSSPDAGGGARRPEKRAPRKSAHQLDGELRPDHPRAERDDVHVVVLDALMGREGIVAERAAHAGQLARGDAGPDAAPADEDSAIGLARARRRDRPPRRRRGSRRPAPARSEPQSTISNPLDRSSARIGSRSGHPAWSHPKATLIGIPLGGGRASRATSRLDPSSRRRARTGAGRDRVTVDRAHSMNIRSRLTVDRSESLNIGCVL